MKRYALYDHNGNLIKELPAPTPYGVDPAPITPVQLPDGFIGYIAMFDLPNDKRAPAAQPDEYWPPYDVGPFQPGESW